MTSQHSNYFFALFFLSFVLSGCGGSSDDNQHLSSGFEPDARVVYQKSDLAPDSLLTIAREVLLAQNSITTINQHTLIQHQATGDGASRKSVNLAAIVSKTMGLVTPLSRYAFAQTLGCSGGGVATIEPVLSKPESGLRPGDYAQIHFENCSNLQGSSLSGELSVIFSFVLGEIGKSPEFAYTADIEFLNLQLTDEQYFSATVNGDISLSQHHTSTTSNQEIINNWVEITGSQQVLVSSIDSARTVSFSENRLVSESSARIQSGNLNHSLKYYTSVPFEGAQDQPPRKGALDVLTANHQHITLTVLEGDQVSLVRTTVDSRGEEVEKEHLQVSWQDLLAQPIAR